MKMSNFENPTWRTVAILNIVISPYLSGESSELIWCADANFDKSDGNVTKIQKFANSKWRMDAAIENQFLVITQVWYGILEFNVP